MSANIAFNLLEKNLLPDWVVRAGIRRLLAERLRREELSNVETDSEATRKFIDELRASPIAIHTEEANDQHYMVPPRFFELVLGPRRKYSCCYYDDTHRTLAEGEDRMLEIYAERAQIEDGQEVLDLGCGWGSFTLWAAERFPRSNFTAISNSPDQIATIQRLAKERGLENVTAQRHNAVELDLEPGRFDRIVTVEMFEHMKNYQALLQRVRRLMKDDGRLFVHIFTHRRIAYAYEDNGPKDWLTRYFFTGGNMPSDDLLLHFQDDVVIDDHWRVSGKHYERTSNQWLENMDANIGEIRTLFEEHYGKDNATLWIARWRTFFMSCAELWGYNDGNEWLVSHYRFKPRT